MFKDSPAKEINTKLSNESAGKRLYCYIVTLTEKLIFNIPVSFAFAYDFYSKNFFERRKYISNADLKKLEALNPNDKSILQSKVDFDSFFKEYIRRDYLYVKNSSFEDFCAFIQKHPTYMEKTNWACEGIGITKHTVNNSDNLETLYKKYSDEYVLLEEVLTQHPAMNDLNSSSVNTVRIATLTHNNEVHIIAAALRMGNGGVTDNLHGGGLCASVDTESGIVQSVGYDKFNKKYFKHPVSNKIIIGFQIPNWDNVIATTIEAAKLIPEFKWIGWDIAVTPVGVAIIEGNHNQGIDLVQIGGEGLKPKIKKIFKN